MSLLDRKVVGLLVGGFALVILLMLVTGYLGQEALRELGRGSTGLLNEEREGGKALSRAQELETELDQIFYSVPGAQDPLSSDTLGPRLATLAASLARIANDGLSSADPAEARAWRDFQSAGVEFVQAVRAASTDRVPTNAAAVARAHRRVLDAVHVLAVQQEALNEEIVNRDREAFATAVGTSNRLLALTGGIAIIVATATVVLVQRLLYRLAWQRAELARLTSDVLQTQEATLRQVAHDLHDQIGQTLTAIEANLGSLDATSRDWAVKGRVEDCIGLVQDLMSQTRSMSQLLRPSVLDDFGLSASLESLAESFGQRTGTQVRFQSTWSGRLHEDTETHLYRIAQEALTNVARHSGASAVHLSLTRLGDTLELAIEDNGRGLSRTAGEPTGVGLRNMRARAREIGGTIAMTPGEHGGFRIVVRSALVPSERHEHEDAVAVS